MRVQVVEHPLIAHKLTQLRRVETSSNHFRQLTKELVMLLSYEASDSIATEPITITTPVTETEGTQLSGPTPLVVPILRAGLGMLDGMTSMIPTAEVGFLGMARNEETLDIITYAERLPDDLTGRHVFVLDPMLATGGTLAEAIGFLKRRNAAEVTCICLLAAPEGIARLEEEVGDLDVDLYLAAIDERLDENAYIVPGLGDAGDRLYGLAE
ncbi:MULTISPECIES: uracil phosphoribosyltransferase [Nesterenkonia]|uniref:Uracil phosphoribosyltransferase n=1 Tax=Nesterenkonia xinjiangensis TaxID=225327 RepID=A0A7Z0K842_9MICC|nr:MULTISPECIES: uracil phosphoribosyltransferase [Nesterenkonia]MDZ5076658.1 uracil phosphoribosyltransferase [Nesterenkonia sp. HG001]NYJ77256.1 uracil phosphoribosyltransferase [Nesterenkonia xinjiangensis]